MYLLAERSRWVDDGGTRGIPGGAIHDGEPAEAAARREAAGEIWPLPRYPVTGVGVQDCGGGSRFHIVRADVSEPFAAYAASQTDATGDGSRSPRCGRCGCILASGSGPSTRSRTTSKRRCKSGSRRGGRYSGCAGRARAGCPASSRRASE